jgi:hypothetical protein
MNAPASPAPVSATRSLSAFAAVRILARLTWTRILRGRALWVSAILAALPCLYGLLMRLKGDFVGEELFAFETLGLSILTPMFVAASLGDEIDDRTHTYLWSRPVPRWSIIAGKLLALVPLVIAVICASWLVAATLAWKVAPPIETFFALAMGVVATALLSSALATLAPKHGMALAICYMLFVDGPVGLMPATLREVSILQQIRTLSGLWPDDGTFGKGIVGIAIIATVFALVALARIRRMEA